MKTGPKPMRRFPLKPLLPILETRFPEPTEWNGGSMIKPVTRCAQALGLSIGASRKWEREGLAESTADRVACLLGYHPASVWPDWYDYYIEEGDYAEAV